MKPHRDVPQCSRADSLSLLLDPDAHDVFRLANTKDAANNVV